MHRSLIAAVILAMAFLGFLVGLAVAPDSLTDHGFSPPHNREYPLPHQVPRYAGGLSLRLAMVHDVLHERFPRHGPAYYAERNRRAQQEIARERAAQSAGAAPSERYFALLDDLGAGLAYQGQFGEATVLMRDKLRRQEALDVTGRPLYSTYANLGTFLVIDGILRSLQGDPAAKALLVEGNGYVHKSIAVNPMAHFGREVWQAVIVEFLIAALDQPELLLKYDMVGNRLDADLSDFETRRPFVPAEVWKDSLKTLDHSVVNGLQKKETWTKEEEAEATAERRYIRKVGAEDDWAEDMNTTQPSPAPFDEPSLAIVGMWTLGAGANPHFAVALGEIMLRVGQRYIAWCRYERAVLTADKFLPDANLRGQFIALCRGRQTLIERSLSPEEAGRLRDRFNAELKHGQDYQARYQQYEADRIAAGTALDDPTFYDAFHAQHGKIGFPLGQADLLLTEGERILPGAKTRAAAAVFGAGLFAFATALFFWWRARRKGGSKK